MNPIIIPRPVVVAPGVVTLSTRTSTHGEQNTGTLARENSLAPKSKGNVLAIIAIGVIMCNLLNYFLFLIYFWIMVINRAVR